MPLVVVFSCLANLSLACNRTLPLKLIFDNFLLKEAIADIALHPVDAIKDCLLALLTCPVELSEQFNVIVVPVTLLGDAK